MDPNYLLALGAFLLAGTVKGAIGIGLPTTVITILTQVMDPRMAVALGVTPMLASNAWQLYREGSWMEPVRRFWPFAVVMMALLFLTSQFAAGADAGALLLFTGVSIASFAVVSLIGSPPRLPGALERPGQIGSGAVAGLMGGFTGLWSPPMVILLLSLRLEKAEYVRTFGFLLLFGSLPLLGGYVSAGLMTRDLFLASLVMLIPTFLGFSLGERIRRRLDTARFQKMILVFFLFMGLDMIRRQVF